MSSFIQVMLFLIIFVWHTKAGDDGYELQFVQLMYRHGDRAPKSIYPTDPNKDIIESVFPLGLSQLTERGRIQHYQLGKLLRQMYKDFFTTKPTEVFALSDENIRCLLSAESNFASFFAPTQKWKFEEDLNWQPIPISSIKFVLDEYLHYPESCPAFQKAFNAQMNAPETKAFNARHQKLYDYITKHSGQNITGIVAARGFYSTLLIEMTYNLTIPNWVDPILDELRDVYKNSFKYAYNSTEIQYLRAGPILGIMNKLFSDKMNGELPELKFQTYSAHDVNLAVVLNALDNLHSETIPYCSTLIFELYKNANDELFIKLLLLDTENDDKYNQIPKVLYLPDCQEYCPYNKYLEVANRYAHIDYQNDCSLPYNNTIL